MCIVSELSGTDLLGLLRRRPLEDAEVAHVLRAVCAGLMHIHLHGLCHADLKPANIFLRGCSLPAKRTASLAEFAQWLVQLPQALCVCIGDLGNAVLANPEQRPPRQSRVEVVGIEEVTLWYRAPEILLGMENFSNPVDMWALGCTAAEMLLRKALFQGNSQFDLIRLIFQTFGTPSEGTLVHLPLFSKDLPSFRSRPWPPIDLLQLCNPRFTDFVRDLLKLEPEQRSSAVDALRHDVFQLQRFYVECAGSPAGRGQVGLVQQTLDPDLLVWLQADPAFEDLHMIFTETAFEPGPCMEPEEREERQKYEECGYVGNTVPDTAVCNGMPADKPCCSERVRLFMLEFFHANKGWMDRPTANVRAALRGLPKAFLGANGVDFLSDPFGETALRYAMFQVMSPGPRKDVVHYDGGASLLHMGLTIFGTRNLVCHFPQEGTRTFRQRPGSIYVGNMCAIKHHVEHEPASAECLGSGEQATQITIMFRSDVFRHGQARKKISKPTPVDMYDIVNTVVASHLSTDPMVLPDFANVARRWEDRKIGGAPRPEAVPEPKEKEPTAKSGSSRKRRIGS